jgi:hypothetical protein
MATAISGLCPSTAAAAEGKRCGGRVETDSLQAGWRRRSSRWHQVLQLVASYRLLARGSEWHLHRQWFERSAIADLLGEDAGLAEIHKLYRRHDRLLEHKQTLFDHLVGRWRDLFNINFDVLLYDLSSTPAFAGAGSTSRRSTVSRRRQAIGTDPEKTLPLSE